MKIKLDIYRYIGILSVTETVEDHDAQVITIGLTNIIKKNGGIFLILDLQDAKLKIRDPGIFEKLKKQMKSLKVKQFIIAGELKKVCDHPTLAKALEAVQHMEGSQVRDKIKLEKEWSIKKAKALELQKKIELNKSATQNVDKIKQENLRLEWLCNFYEQEVKKFKEDFNHPDFAKINESPEAEEELKKIKADILAQLNQKGIS